MPKILIGCYQTDLNLPVYISWRYLFSKKSHNVINIISAISVFGILVTTTALIVVLSAFNGIEGLVDDLYSSFDSDIRIELAEGKTFNSEAISKQEILQVLGVEHCTRVIEEVVWIRHEDLGVVATMKGVENDFLLMSGLDTMIIEGGAYLTQEQPTSAQTIMNNSGQIPFAIIGAGIKRKLQVSAGAHSLDYLTIHGPVRGEKISARNSDAFNKEDLGIAGAFSINIDFDTRYIVVPIEFAAGLIEYENEITAVEVGVFQDYDAEETKLAIQNLLGDDFKVQTRYEQNKLIYETNQTEKWMTFLILAFILIISAFNIVASLTMLILDKKRDISVLTSMGAQQSTIRNIFFNQGLFINLLGGGLGILIGFLICKGQEMFHWVALPGTMIDHYPVEMQGRDFMLVMLTVCVIGVLASWLPVRYLIKQQFQAKT